VSTEERPPAGEETAPAAAPAAPSAPGLSRVERARLHGRRIRVYSWALLLIAAVVVIVALIVSNTRQVKVSWVFGHSHASLVWLVIIPAIVGWFAGVASAFLLRRRVRARGR